MLGPRVPLIVISPYSRPRFVSHTQYDFRSVVKFVEQTFSLPAKTVYDRNVNSISNMLNFNQKVLPPKQLLTAKCASGSNSQANIQTY